MMRRSSTARTLGVQGDPTEGALIVAARKFGIDESARASSRGSPKSRSPRERKRHTTVHADRDNPEPCASSSRARRKSCSRNAGYVGRTARPSRSATPTAPSSSQRNEALACQALRTLAIATRTVPAVSLGIDPKSASDVDRATRERRGRSDPPGTCRHDRSTAYRGAGCGRIAERAHIRSVMITGDHPATAEAIARELTIFEAGSRLVTGNDLRAWRRRSSMPIVEHVRVFARVDPEHKLASSARCSARGTSSR